MKNIIRLWWGFGLLLCSGSLVYSQEAMSNKNKEITAKPLLKNAEIMLADVSGKIKERLNCILYMESLKRGSQTTPYRIYLATNDHLKKEIWSHEIDDNYASREFTASSSQEETALAYTSVNKAIFICPIRMGAERSYRHLEGCSDDVESIDLFQQFGQEAFDGGVDALAYNIKIKKLYFDQTWHLDIMGDEGKIYRFKRLDRNKWVHTEAGLDPKK